MDATTEGDAPPMARVTVYWRPGCSFCWSLRRTLRSAGVDAEERNIWDDPEAAAFVRSHAGGNETVPTVEVDGRVMVNPRARDVLAAAGVPTRRSRRRWGSWMRR